MRRVTGITACLATHALFAWTVWKLFWFLSGEAVPSTLRNSVWLDAGLALLFGAAHSALLYPTVRETLSRHITPAFYGLFYCVVTCVSLLALIDCWQHSPALLWEWSGPFRFLVNAGWFGSWASLLYSLHLGGAGYQTGWTPWWHWFRDRPIPPRPFAPRGLYLSMRHPVYLSFLGLVWLSPVITADRLILIATWTPYVLIGSYLKDERMAHYLGETYRHYQARVPGFPGLVSGPLGIRPLVYGSAAAEMAPAGAPVTGRQGSIEYRSPAGDVDERERASCSLSH